MRLQFIAGLTGTSLMFLGASTAGAMAPTVSSLGMYQLEHRVPACDIGTPDMAPNSKGKAPVTNPHCQTGHPVTKE
jgi:hypothetical protein